MHKQCGDYVDFYCLYNNGLNLSTPTHQTIQISVYYFNPDGSRELVGQPIHVTNNKAGILLNDKSGIIEDRNISRNSAQLENYFMNTTNFKTYLGYMGIDYTNLTRPSQPAPNGNYGYRFVIEPEVTAYLNRYLYLVTPKEIAQVGANSRYIKTLSAMLYLVYPDVGISAGNPNGASSWAEIKNLKTGWGYNIIDLTSKINELNPVCNYNNPNHFASSTSGPNGEDCCSYVLDNLKEYNITSSQLYDKYPRCRGNILKNCKFELTTSKPNCTGSTSYGRISDISVWDCIYASAYSTDSTIKNYFLKYSSPDNACKVYCRDEIEYYYPGNGMIALAGNYFTINDKLASYSTYLEGNEKTKIKPASLGPIKTITTRECSIAGTSNYSCETELNKQLSNLSSKAPEIEFSYESKYYNNPVENLQKVLKDDKTTTNGNLKSRKLTYYYSLPDNTYKYVSKNTGISYKVTSLIGKYPYLNIGAHSPIHFSEKPGSLNYQLTIKKFNLTNFDKVVLGGQTMSTNFVTSIETYIRTLMSSGNASLKNINGIYYLDQTFIKLLNKNNYTTDNFLAMSCANTNKYTCNSDYNGIYCYDKNTTTNSEQTYKNLENCIKQKVQDLTSQKANYKNDMLYSCKFTVENKLIPDPDSNDSKSNDLNVIFRPISLNNPFPGFDGKGRKTGSNWCYGMDCSNTNPIVESTITNNRDTTKDDIYRKLDPLYTITLNPGLIKEIREYNKKNSYDDFNLKCNTDGYKCLSDFIRVKYERYFKGCGISGKDTGLNCTSIDNW